MSSSGNAWMRLRPADDNPDDGPDELVELSLPLTQYRIEEDDERNLIIVATDVATEVIFGVGELGTLDAQIIGAERAAEMWSRYLSMLRVRRGDRKVLQMLADAAPDPGTWGHRTHDVPPANA